MSNEVWWLARGSGDIGTKIYIGDKPEIIVDPYNSEKTIAVPAYRSHYVGILSNEFAGDFIKDGETIPVRPLRIERVEVQNG